MISVPTDRGQTTLDFAIGTSVFLLATIFVVAYVPTMFDPFAGGGGSKLVVADHAAATLSGDLLATSTAEPGTLSVGCVAAFFDAGPAEFCGTDFDDEEQMLALDDRNAAVTIHPLDASPTSPATLPETAIDDSHNVDSDADLAWTNAPDSQRQDVAVATRTVSVAGDQYRMTVEVW
ncbi:uncharacterized protein NP_4018A [Natronomonas pharaonis DSM 2160]|uniref:Uncharacterized protein n=1 Tax=Natronomonas pharaonis (strain ATCC 35678 / DSM 2160 / CIP 103997 / JCM 8858 / NBRC 14720 / NCIMB 2260 / Gabara) TaxID=348780 RepID=A0A1U7EY29_NATPD|nr:hypothetical protein [Natronomonas pharaonis]CAI50100.1 uncharacterized protein NP_4018A [Natronomonas pharaonis DSM 2160]